MTGYVLTVLSALLIKRLTLKMVLQMKKEYQKFRAKITKAGINPCVRVPKKISETLEIRGHVPVNGTLNGVPIRATLVPLGDGRHHLYVNGEMRKNAGVKVGDIVHLALKLDTKPRTVPIPEEFAIALDKHKEAKAVFEKLLPSKQKEILVYLNWIKRPDTLRRNIEKIISKLSGIAG